MKKIIISAFVIVAFAIYSIHARNEQSSVNVAAPTSLQTKSSSNGSNSNAATTTSSSSSSSNSQSSSSAYKDGSYTGSQADAYYGYVQVKAVISGGKITDVQFLNHPSDRQESVAINTQAMPLLKQEAIQAQSAQIDGVSGATDTSQAFIESLNAALNQAKA